MAEGDGPVGFGGSGPYVVGIVSGLVVMAFLDPCLAGAVEGENEVRVGDVRLGDGGGGGSFLPVLTEEEAGPVLRAEGAEQESD
jgi:hypothetical protein